MTQFYNSMTIKSYNAVFNFVLGARNLGKTWAYKMRAIKRFTKHGNKTCWVRRFAVEAKRTQQDFYPKSMLTLLGIDPENIKTLGNKVYYQVKPKKWEWFVEIVALSAQQSQKSVDCEEEDTIVFDEFTTTPDKYRMYRGDEVRDFLDLWTTKRRYHEVYCFFLGNKETVTNPYFNYFVLDPPSTDFQGIVTHKNHTIAIEQINDVPDVIETTYDDKVKSMLDGTEYGNYLYGGAIKTLDETRIVPRPTDAKIYCCFDFGHPISLYKCPDGRMWFSEGVDPTRLVVTTKPTTKYNNVYIMLPSDRKKMASLSEAYKMHRLFYSSPISEEQGVEILAFFGFISRSTR